MSVIRIWDCNTNRESLDSQFRTKIFLYRWVILWDRSGRFNMGTRIITDQSWEEWNGTYNFFFFFFTCIWYSDNNWSIDGTRHFRLSTRYSDKKNSRSIVRFWLKLKKRKRHKNGVRCTCMEAVTLLVHAFKSLSFP